MNHQTAHATPVNDRIISHIDEHLARRGDAPVGVSVSPSAILERIRETYAEFSKPSSLEDVFDDVTQMLWEWSEHATNTRHFGLTRPTVDKAAVVADMVAALYDPNLATWDFSPAAQQIERYTLNILAGFFGKGFDNSSTHFTSGGQEANHTAVAAALTAAFPQVGKFGIRDLEAQPTIYVSEEGHHSFDKIAHLTGIGRASVRYIPTTSRFVMDVDEARTQIERDIRDGLRPFLVVATAGTISAGMVDPLVEIAGIAEEYGLWYHVDAAWGGAAAVSKDLRPLLAGIERADSITCDAHKLFSTTVGAGMFFCRRPDVIQQTFNTNAAYVPDHAGTDKVYPYVSSMQWSRRFIGLKLFMMLAVRGLHGVRQRIEHQTRMGHVLRTRLSANGWTLVNDAQLPVVCFTHPRIDGDVDQHRSIVQELKQGQTAWISKTMLGGKPTLRASVTNYETQMADLDVFVSGLTRALERCADTTH